MRTLLAKIAALAILDALSVYVILGLFGAGAWPVALVVAAIALGLNLLYLGPWAVPAKYLAPGVLLLVTFQLFSVVYSGYIAFTNYGQGHLGSKEDAIAALGDSGRERVPDSPEYPVTVLDQGGTLWFLVTNPDGTASVGTAGAPLTPAPDASFSEAGKATGLSGFTTLRFAEVLGRQQEVLALEVPLSADQADGTLRTPDGSNAYVYRPVLVFDAARDAFVDTRTGAVFADNGQGNFASDGGEVLQPGWRAVVGLGNFGQIVGALTADGQLFGVFIWTFVFAILAVVSAAALGIFLALVFNDPRLRFRRVYRIVLILPYAFPVFLSILIWGGLLNPQYGFINQMLLGGAYIPWLQDPWLARFSVLFVNLWLDFPYWFLVATGALQSVPKELEEAAYLDGAGRWRLFRSVRFPLLMISLSPLVVSAFAFAFNNFNLVWLLTRGGPEPLDSEIGAGATDLLITITYKIAFVENVKNYGLASALSAVIFMLVAAVAIYGFRRTRRYEEIY